MTEQLATAPEASAEPALELFNDFSTKVELAEEGTWIPYRKGVEFLIARQNCRAYRRATATFLKDHEAEAERVEDQDLQDRLIRDSRVYAMARGILRGWRGNFVFKGQALPYTLANAEALLKMDDFADWVTRQANNLENYRDKFLADSEGN